MSKIFGLTIAVLFLLAGISNGQAATFKAGGTLLNVKLRPVTEMHFKDVVRQQYDLSCGAAAMATLLQYFYEQDVKEKAIIDAMIKLGDPERIAESGFSMLELKWFAEDRGFVAQGYRIDDPDHMRNLEVPVITLINTRGYLHFVVLKAVRGDEAVIADPAFGNVVKSFDQFSSEWSNVVLVVLSKKLNGAHQFAQDFSIKAPLSETTLLTTRGYRALPPGPGEF